MSLSGHKKGEKYCARCVMLGTGACVCMCVAACRVQLRLTGSDRHGTGTPKKRIGMKITKRQAVRPLLRYVVAGIAASQTERWGAGWRALCSSAVLWSHALVRCPFRQPVGVHGHGRAVPGSRSCAGPCACPCRPRGGLANLGPPCRADRQKRLARTFRLPASPRPGVAQPPNRRSARKRAVNATRSAAGSTAQNKSLRASCCPLTAQLPRSKIKIDMLSP